MQNRFGFDIPPLTSAFSDPRATQETTGLFSAVGLSLGLQPADAAALPQVVQHALKSGESNAEIAIREWIAAHTYKPLLVTQIETRCAQICTQIRPFLCGPVIADIGCGDGLVAHTLCRDYDLVLVDVVDYLDRRVHLPFRRYSANGPLPIEEQVDCSLLLTVLHHADDPFQLLGETMRVTKRRIVIIESVVPEPEAPDFHPQFQIAALFDWFYNRVLHDSVPVPYNYNSVRGWKSLFDDTPWQLTYVVDLGRDQKLVPEKHVLFVIERRRL